MKDWQEELEKQAAAAEQKRSDQKLAEEIAELERMRKGADLYRLGHQADPAQELPRKKYIDLFKLGNR